MDIETTMTESWARWRALFEARRIRPLPDPFVDQPQLADLPASVARSLAIFQLGESGGGTVVRQAQQSRLPGVNEDYADAVALFVAEEHRHAEILACCVRMLGGRLLKANWTAKLFVIGRRLLGLRLKIMVLLAAEIVGICYYRLLASRLPASPLRTQLEAIAADERLHLDFHCSFLRTQTRSWGRSLVFRGGWRLLTAAAAAVALLDHRQALRDLDIDLRLPWRRFTRYSRRAAWMADGWRAGAARPAGTCLARAGR